VQVLAQLQVPLALQSSMATLFGVQWVAQQLVAQQWVGLCNTVKEQKE